MTITYARELDVAADVDVLVAGGGPAGLAPRSRRRGAAPGPCWSSSTAISAGT
ncbi:hypothetical protein K1T35_26825 [Pseudonocardia sp. DSM 110487]|uniref:hypothetical protein n=1 Tax=Pseudonocardia sp. DSM 110487 TaxID=2865833 RepID=UPI001C6A3BE5|nr:hypothetical protein [Pseudonocardia sp. DSM 110487]QYN32220.1 hypothetical protein K1T35_26825 [Pseudonocardia sp. DSM 110487]